MTRYVSLWLAMLAGVALAAAINELDAQGKPLGVYAVLDIGEVVDPSALTGIVIKAAETAKAGGVRYLARTDKIAALSGTPPKRVVIVAFDNVGRATAWYNSPAQQMRLQKVLLTHRSLS